MTSQPRKFSEKIALHNQKQAEGDAAFQQIMREVTDVTSNQPFRSNMEDLHCSRVDATSTNRVRGRSESFVGPMRSKPVEKQRVDTSPYCISYLSPPTSDLGWRRTNSDSALHRSVQNLHNNLHGHSPGSQRRVLENHQHYDPSRIRHTSASPEERPRSCVPSIPNITIFPSQQEPGTIQIPIGNNTGSLPDLTSFQFSSPIHTPLDQDDHHSSTYSSASPQCTSPSTLSPTSLPPRTPGRFSFSGTPPHESSEPPSYASISPSSPTSSKHLSVPNAQHSGYMHSTPKCYVLDGSPVESNSYQMQSQIQQSPSLHKQPQHVNQHNIPKHQLLHQQSQQKQQQQPQQQQPQQQVSLQQQSSCQNHQQSSPLQSQRTTQYNYPQSSILQRPPVNSADTSADSINSHKRASMTSYRSQTNSRPSPQPSPVLNIKQYNSNNTSPLSSAPQSPTSPVNCNSIQQTYHSSNDYYANQAQETLQQHFEQIRMLDSPVSDYGMNNGSSNSYQQPDDLNVPPPNELNVDQNYFNASSTSQLPYHNAANSAQSTPNTPSSIPDIVLTDFSTTTDEFMRRDMTKDFACDISNLFPTGDTLRDGIDPIDFEGLQMFTQDILNSDSSSQSHFALDH